MAALMPTPPASTTPAPAPAAKSKLPDGFVRAVLPKRYSSVEVVGPGGKTSIHEGGQTVVISAAQAADLKAEVLAE